MNEGMISFSEVSAQLTVEIISETEVEVWKTLIKQNETIEKLLEKQISSMETLQREQLETMKIIAKAIEKLEKRSSSCESLSLKLSLRTSKPSSS